MPAQPTKAIETRQAIIDDILGKYIDKSTIGSFKYFFGPNANENTKNTCFKYIDNIVNDAKQYQRQLANAKAAAAKNLDTTLIDAAELKEQQGCTLSEEEKRLVKQNQANKEAIKFAEIQIEHLLKPLTRLKHAIVELHELELLDKKIAGNQKIKSNIASMAKKLGINFMLVEKQREINKLIESNDPRFEAAVGQLKILKLADIKAYDILHSIDVIHAEKILTVELYESNPELYRYLIENQLGIHEDAKQVLHELKIRLANLIDDKNANSENIATLRKIVDVIFQSVDTETKLDMLTDEIFLQHLSPEIIQAYKLSDKEKVEITDAVYNLIDEVAEAEIPNLDAIYKTIKQYQLGWIPDANVMLELFKALPKDTKVAKVKPVVINAISAKISRGKYQTDSIDKLLTAVIEGKLSLKNANSDKQISLLESDFGKNLLLQSLANNSTSAAAYLNQLGSTEIEDILNSDLMQSQSTDALAAFIDSIQNREAVEALFITGQQNITTYLTTLNTYKLKPNGAFAVYMKENLLDIIQKHTELTKDIIQNSMANSIENFDNMQVFAAEAETLLKTTLQHVTLTDSVAKALMGNPVLFNRLEIGTHEKIINAINNDPKLRQELLIKLAVLHKAQLLVSDDAAKLLNDLSMIFQGEEKHEYSEKITLLKEKLHPTSLPQGYHFTTEEDLNPDALRKKYQLKGEAADASITDIIAQHNLYNLAKQYNCKTVMTAIKEEKTDNAAIEQLKTELFQIKFNNTSNKNSAKILLTQFLGCQNDSIPDLVNLDSEITDLLATTTPSTLIDILNSYRGLDIGVVENRLALQHILKLTLDAADHQVLPFDTIESSFLDTIIATLSSWTQAKDPAQAELAWRFFDSMMAYVVATDNTELQNKLQQSFTNEQIKKYTTALLKNKALSDFDPKAKNIDDLKITDQAIILQKILASPDIIPTDENFNADDYLHLRDIYQRIAKHLNAKRYQTEKTAFNNYMRHVLEKIDNKEDKKLRRKELLQGHKQRLTTQRQHKSGTVILELMKRLKDDCQYTQQDLYNRSVYSIYLSNKKNYLEEKRNNKAFNREAYFADQYEIAEYMSINKQENKEALDLLKSEGEIDEKYLASYNKIQQQANANEIITAVIKSQLEKGTSEGILPKRLGDFILSFCSGGDLEIANNFILKWIDNNMPHETIEQIENAQTKQYAQPKVGMVIYDQHGNEIGVLNEEGKLDEKELNKKGLAYGTALFADKKAKHLVGHLGDSGAIDSSRLFDPALSWSLIRAGVMNKVQLKSLIHHIITYEYSGDLNATPYEELVDTLKNTINSDTTQGENKYTLLHEAFLEVIHEDKPNLSDSKQQHLLSMTNKLGSPYASPQVSAFVEKIISNYADQNADIITKIKNRLLSKEKQPGRFMAQSLLLKVMQLEDLAGHNSTNEFTTRVTQDDAIAQQLLLEKDDAGVPKFYRLLEQNFSGDEENLLKFLNNCYFKKNPTSVEKEISNYLIAFLLSQDSYINTFSKENLRYDDFIGKESGVKTEGLRNRIELLNLESLPPVIRQGLHTRVRQELWLNLDMHEKYDQQQDIFDDLAEKPWGKDMLAAITADAANATQILENMEIDKKNDIGLKYYVRLLRLEGKKKIAGGGDAVMQGMNDAKLKYEEQQKINKKLKHIACSKEPLGFNNLMDSLDSKQAYSTIQSLFSQDDVLNHKVSINQKQHKLSETRNFCERLIEILACQKPATLLNFIFGRLDEQLGKSGFSICSQTAAKFAIQQHWDFYLENLLKIDRENKNSTQFRGLMGFLLSPEGQKQFGNFLSPFNKDGTPNKKLEFLVKGLGSLGADYDIFNHISSPEARQHFIPIYVKAFKESTVVGNPRFVSIDGRKAISDYLKSPPKEKTALATYMETLLHIYDDKQLAETLGRQVSFTMFELLGNKNAAYTDQNRLAMLLTSMKVNDTSTEKKQQKQVRNVQQNVHRGLQKLDIELGIFGDGEVFTPAIKKAQQGAQAIAKKLTTQSTQQKIATGMVQSLDDPNKLRQTLNTCKDYRQMSTFCHRLLSAVKPDTTSKALGKQPELSQEAKKVLSEAKNEALANIKHQERLNGTFGFFYNIGFKLRLVGGKVPGTRDKKVRDYVEGKQKYTTCKVDIVTEKARKKQATARQKHAKQQKAQGKSSKNLKNTLSELPENRQAQKIQLLEHFIKDLPKIRKGKTKGLPKTDSLAQKIMGNDETLMEDVKKLNDAQFKQLEKALNAELEQLKTPADTNPKSANTARQTQHSKGNLRKPTAAFQAQAKKASTPEKQPEQDILGQLAADIAKTMSDTMEAMRPKAVDETSTKNTSAQTAAGP